MPSPLPPRLRAVGLGIALVFGMIAPAARADHAPPTAALRNSASSEPDDDPLRRPFAPRNSSTARASSAATGGGGWWLGTAGVALALAVFGGLSLASRRFLPQGHAGPLRVVGRASLSPKQSVYLLQVGDRVLIVGAGQNGPPALLGELDDPSELVRRAPASPASGPVSVPTVRIDQRIGGEA